MTHTAAELATFVVAYMDTIRFTEAEDGDYGVDFNRHFFADESILRIVEDCERFLELTGDLLREGELAQAAHDFWLSRNGHGAGFFDGDWQPQERGDELQRIARDFGECDVYVGDDRKIYTT